MIFLYVFLGLILFLFASLCCPIKVFVSFKNSLIVKVKFLFFSFDLFPEQKKRQTIVEDEKNKKINQDILKKDKKNQIKSQDNKFLSIIKEEGFLGFLRILKAVADILFESARKVLKKIHISSFNLYLLVAKDNAADTAIGYARVYTLISYATSVLLRNIDESKYYIEVIPGFNETECKVDFSAEFYFFPISMLGIALVALFKFVKNVYLNSVSERV